MLKFLFSEMYVFCFVRTQICTKRTVYLVPTGADDFYFQGLWLGRFTLAWTSCDPLLFAKIKLSRDVNEYIEWQGQICVSRW